MKKIISLILMLACILSLVCGSVSHAAASGDDSGYHFVFIAPNQKSEYWEAVIAGIRRADEQQGTETEILGPNTDSFVDYNRHIAENWQALLARDELPDGIMTFAGGVPGIDDFIAQATEKGIPVVAIDSDSPSSQRVAYVGTNQINMGVKAGQIFADLLPEKAKMAVVMINEEDTGGSDWTVQAALENVVSDYGIEIVAMCYMGEDADASSANQTTEKRVVEMLEAHPDVSGIFVTGAVNSIPTLRAKQTLGRDDLIIIGLDDTEENIASVKEGGLDGVIAQNTSLMGYLSAGILKKYLDTGSLSQKSYDTGCTYVTLENVDTYKNQALDLDPTIKTVRIGYYDANTPTFQDGFAEGELKSGYAYEYYQMIAAFAGWRYEYEYCDRAEVIDKLIAGEIDIAAGSRKTNTLEADVLFSKETMGILDNDLGVQDGYFVISRQSAALLPELNYAMTQIKKVFPAFTIELNQKYFSQASQLELTEKEENWLFDKETIRFGYTRHHMPFSEQDEAGNPTGLVRDMIDWFEEYAHVQVEPVCYEYVADMEEALRSGEIDMGFPIYSNLSIAEQKGLVQTVSVVSDRVMIVFKDSYTNELMRDVAISRAALGQKNYLAEHYPESGYTEYGSFEDALDAIKSGKERCIVGSASIFQYRLNGYKDSNEFNISYLPETENFSIAVSQDSSVLAAIANKYISQLDKGAVTSRLIHYSYNELELSFGDFLVQYGYVFAIILIAVLAVLMVVFAAYLKRTKEYNRKQEDAQLALKEAVGVAERANRAKTDFLSSMSHDIRTPMNAIIGMTNIAVNHMDDTEKVKDCLGKISLSSKHLLTLINDVLDISKIESGKLTLSPINFSLRDTVDNLVNIVRPMIKEKSLEFEIHIHRMDYEMVYADELRINQIFINILSNAVKYTPEGGRIVMTLSEDLSEDGKSVRLIYVVEDNGMGMSEEYLQTMYDTFSRANDSRTNKIQGSGLGLAIVKQIVTLMQGTIDCESELDKGTKFTITLDLPLSEGEEKDYSLPGVSLLLVDDDGIFLEITKNVLDEMKVEAETANSGPEAVEMVQKRHDTGSDYDVIIVDWKMPGMDGLETVKAVRRVVGPNAVIILVSAYDWTEIEEDAGRCGANGFISKPLFKSYLYERLHEVLDTGEKAEVHAEEADNKLGGLHLLVAEDNELNWEVISELLGMYAVTADWAENGMVCVDMLESAPEGTYALVLMDVQMPVMDGREATRIIRKSQKPYVRSIPIIAMTADAFVEDMAACLEAGMNAHVAKPVDMAKLFHEIHNILGQ